jgi:hypothetical protein
MNTRELVDALISGDSIAIEDTFNTVMSQKVSSALDTYRVEVAQNMMGTPEQETTVDDNAE